MGLSITGRKLHRAIDDNNFYGMIALVKGGADVEEVNAKGQTALLHAGDAVFHQLEMVQWLVETGGADMSVTDHDGNTIWDALEFPFKFCKLNWVGEDAIADSRSVSALLRVLVLREGPPERLTPQLRPYHQTVVEQGARLRGALPAWFAQRRSFLGEILVLIDPLLDLVSNYDGGPSTTQEFWDTGLGAAPHILSADNDDPMSESEEEDRESESDWEWRLEPTDFSRQWRIHGSPDQ
jgi:hypothetical protein